jgi:creatinine amidohydrolase
VLKEMTALRLEALTHTEIADLDQDHTVVVMPAGSIEQHGPHLPLDTDTFLCSQVAWAAAELAHGGPVLVTPTLCFGSSEHHMSFAGTLTLSQATFGDSVRELCASAARHGFTRQLVVNGHGGNSALLAAAVQDVPMHGSRVATVDYWTLAADVAGQIRESPPGGMGHACEFETSLMLYLRPESVRTDAIQREIVATRFGRESFDLLRKGILSARWRTDDLSRSGVMGAPDVASAEKGQRFFEACAEGLAAIIEDMR